MTDPDIHAAAAALGRAGGLKGGPKGGRSKSKAKLAAAKRNLRRAAEAMTPDQRREIAQKAAQARWARAKACPR